MSLAINTDHVTEVLLADGWHMVTDQSFDLDSYEYIWAAQGHDAEDLLVHGGNSGVCATGYVFTTGDGDNMAGPLTAILAVRYSSPKEK